MLGAWQMFFLIPTAPRVPNMETEAQGGRASCLIRGAGEFTSVQRLSRVIIMEVKGVKD